jgi:hypothetical protein
VLTHHPDAGFLELFVKILPLNILFSQIKTLQPCKTERPGGLFGVYFQQKNIP